MYKVIICYGWSDLEKQLNKYSDEYDIVEITQSNDTYSVIMSKCAL